jgi:hypothetical protein
LFSALRSGKSYAGACVAANIAPLTLYRWRKLNPRFEAKLKAARREGLNNPGAYPPQAMVIDSFGNIVDNSEVVCTEEERMRLIKLRERMLSEKAGGASAETPDEVKVPRGNGRMRDRIRRLIRLREAWEAEQAAKTEPVISTSPELQQRASTGNVVRSEGIPNGEPAPTIIGKIIEITPPSICTGEQSSLLTHTATENVLLCVRMNC